MKKKKVLLMIVAVIILLIAVFFAVTGAWKPFPAMFTQDQFFENWSPEQEYTKDYAVTLQKDPDKDFVVLNLTDIQLLDFDVYGEKGKDAEAMIKELIEKTNPDLITLTGDNAWGLLASVRVAEYIDSFEIPWAPVMGNHDGQFAFGKFYSSYYYEIAENCLWKYGPKDMGYGNYIINIEENGKVIHSMFMMDTHSEGKWTNENGEEVKGYDHLWENQIEWYTWAVEGIEKTEGQKVESSAFMHIPVFEYKEIWEKYYDVEADKLKEPYAEGSFGVLHEKTCPAEINNYFMDKVLELGSTQNMFFGHDHLNSASFLYEGVRLSYGLKLGQGCYFEEGLQGGTTFTIDSTGSGVVEHIYIE